MSEYDTIQIGYYKNDKKFIVHLIAGVIFYDTLLKNMDSCLQKKQDIEEEISSLLNIEFSKNDSSTDQGMFYGVKKVLENGDKVRLYCTDWFENTENEKGWSDNLRLELLSSEFYYES